MSRLRLALLGLGNVGSGVWSILKEDRDRIARLCGTRVEVARVMVRDLERHRSGGVPRQLLTTDFQDIALDPTIGVVVEVMGTVEPARTYVLEALRRGTSVVTANKDLVALHWAELMRAQAEHGAHLLFEASVAAGVPIIRSLKESLAANRISEIVGIINGTTNYVLTRMAEDGAGLHDALARATELGYAEADPSSDISGRDAAYKLAILASMAFGRQVDVRGIHLQGMEQLGQVDIEYAGELGYTIKFLAIARALPQGIEARVQPVLLPRSHPLASIRDEFNAVFVRGSAAGELMFYGRGAGGEPTASAVVGDIMAVAKALRVGSNCEESVPLEGAPMLPVSEVRCRHYLRLVAADRPGVLALVADAFGRESVSLATVLQKRAIDGDAEIVVVTHQASRRSVYEAVSAITQLPVVSRIENVMAVEGGG